MIEKAPAAFEEARAVPAFNFFIDPVAATGSVALLTDKRTVMALSLIIAFVTFGAPVTAPQQPCGRCQNCKMARMVHQIDLFSALSLVVINDTICVVETKHTYAIVGKCLTNNAVYMLI